MILHVFFQDPISMLSFSFKETFFFLLCCQHASSSTQIQIIQCMQYIELTVDDDDNIVIIIVVTANLYHTLIGEIMLGRW